MARYTLRFFSKSLFRKTEVNIVMPSLNLAAAMAVKDKDYYRHSEEKFPLFVLMGGFGSDNEEWLIQANLPELCDKYRIAAVCLNGENKWYLDSSPIDGFSTFIEEELPDFLYGNFSKLDDTKKPVICGVSMGGFGALFNGLSHPENHSAIISLSPAIKPDGYMGEGKYPDLRELFLQSKGKLPYTWLAIGERDFIAEPTKAFDQWLTENAIGVNYRFVPEHVHNWAFWRIEIENVLRDMKEKGII